MTTAHLEHDPVDAAKLQRVVLTSPILGSLVTRWPAVALPDCWLVAGAVAQTVWNDAFGLAPDHGL